jgi:phytoene synthase
LPPVRKTENPPGLRRLHDATRSTAARSPKKSASNLALAFILLPREKRDAMSTLYAFCREVDDVADDETVPTETRRAQLADWRNDVKRACKNESPEFPVNRELQPIIKQLGLPF